MVGLRRGGPDGMGFRVELTPEQASRGFDRLFVLGVRLTADDDRGGRRSRSCSRITASAAAASRSCRRARRPTTPRAHGPRLHVRRRRRRRATTTACAAANFTPEPDALLRSRRRSASPRRSASIPRASPTSGTPTARDRRDARAMQTALWPATLGYLLDTMLPDVVRRRRRRSRRATVLHAATSAAAAPVPAVRVGDQPYGVLPDRLLASLLALASSVGGDRAFLSDCRRDVLRRSTSDWAAMAEDVPFVGSDGVDAHATLLDDPRPAPRVGRVPLPLRREPRRSSSTLNLGGLGGGFLEALIQAALDAPALQLLPRLGRDGTGPVELLEQLLPGPQGRLRGPVIDDRPLSETEPIRAYTTDGRNYLRWLVDAARHVARGAAQGGRLHRRRPADGAAVPARCATRSMLGYADCGSALLPGGGRLDATLREPAFIHIDPAAKVSESRFEPLYRREVRITDNEDVTVAEHIAAQLPFARREPPAAGAAAGARAARRRAHRQARTRAGRAHRHRQLPLRRVAARLRGDAARADARDRRRGAARRPASTLAPMAGCSTCDRTRGGCARSSSTASRRRCSRARRTRR